MAGPVRGVAGAAAEASGPAVTGRAGAVPQRPARRQPWAWGAGSAAAGTALFAAYVRLSATYPVNSDGANIVLMAWDMLHGNLVLHNWWMSGVSFYTTELPEYMLIDGFFNYWYPPSQVGATFGAPARTYQLGPYTVLVWTHNLMPALHRWAMRTGAAVTAYRFGPTMPSGHGLLPLAPGALLWGTLLRRARLRYDAVRGYKIWVRYRATRMTKGAAHAAKAASRRRGTPNRTSTANM